MLKNAAPEPIFNSIFSHLFRNQRSWKIQNSHTTFERQNTTQDNFYKGDKLGRKTKKKLRTIKLKNKKSNHIKKQKPETKTPKYKIQKR